MTVRAALPRVPRVRSWGALLWPLLLLLCLLPGVLPRLVQPLAAGELLSFDPPLWRLTLTHLGLVGISTLAAVLLGVPLAVAVTRPGREALRQLTESLVGLGQTVPTFAILALAVPVLGFGWPPTLLGLLAYGLVPVVSNAVAGLLAVDRGVLDAARGMGMTRGQLFWRVQLPLALPVWLSGVRQAAVLLVGVAAVAALIGAGGLGSYIFKGLQSAASDLILLGAVPAALLALGVDAALRRLETLLGRWLGRAA